MAITGLHGLFYTSEAEKLRAMLRDAFGFKSVDAGGGWLIFAMPPAELGVHPDEGPTFESGVRHQMAFMCDNIGKTIAELRGKGVTVAGEPKNEGYGITTMLHLPGGCEVMLYEPRHPTALSAVASAKADGMNAPAKRRAAKTTATRKASAKKKSPKKGASPRRGRQAAKAGRRR
jgi:hypothetical protein